jgi:hypothetical protein
MANRFPLIVDTTLKELPSGDNLDLTGSSIVLGGTVVTATGAELNLLDGVSGLVQADLTKLAAVDATAAELNLLDGKTFIDSDSMSGASATTISSSESIKAYVDAGGGAYSDWSILTTTANLAAKGQYICNHASTAFTVTLPAASVSGGNDGDTVIVANAGAATVTIARNSSNINSAAADGTLPQGNSVQLVYVDDTIGWFEV